MSDTNEEAKKDEGFEYLENPTTAKTGEETWCKIGPEGKLDYFDWAFVEKTAREFDAAGPIAKKNNAQIICKLAVLIREQTINRCVDVLNKYSVAPATATTVMLKDPLEE